MTKKLIAPLVAVAMAFQPVAPAVAQEAVQQADTYEAPQPALGGGAIAGIVVGSLALAGLIGLVGYVIYATTMPGM